MNKKELNFILQEGEGYKIEFKESFDKSIAKEMVAFVNSEGGRIFLGVNDNGIVKGIKITNKLKSQIQDLVRNCDPSVAIELEVFDNILILKVKEGENKPFRCSSGFYLRQGGSSVKLRRDEIVDFINEESKVKFDEIISDEFKYPLDFDKKKFDEYLQRAEIIKTVSSERLLKELGAIRNSKFTNAGVLFFARNPQRFTSHSVFSCALFRDKEGSNIIDRKEVGGSLVNIVEDVMKFVEKNIRVAYKFTGKPKREDIYEYPLEAIREAVINSVMHRDYFEGGHNNILKIYPDKILITNVWLKPSWFKLGKDTFRRNKVVADLFLRIGFIERLGTGFERMKNFCQNASAPIFKLDVDEKFFRITFFKSKDYLDIAKKGERLVEKLAERLAESQKKILDLIKINPYISKKELSEKIGISSTAIDKNIAKLKQKGLLKRIGPAKGGHWEIKR